MELGKIKEESKNLRKEVREKTMGYITAAFGLIAGLAWNDAVKSLIELIFPAQANGVAAKFLYAVIITIIAVFAIVAITRVLQRDSTVPILGDNGAGKKGASED